MKLGPRQQAWVDALRSGKYQQGRDFLCLIKNDEIKYCCLGVACELFKEKTGIKIDQATNEISGSTYRLYDHDVLCLSEKIQKYLQMKSATGVCATSSLAEINDKGMSFKEIADLIEEKADELFYKSV